MLSKPVSRKQSAKQPTKAVSRPLPNGKRAALEEELDSGASSGDEDLPSAKECL